MMPTHHETFVLLYLIIHLNLFYLKILTQEMKYLSFLFFISFNFIKFIIFSLIKINIFNIKIQSPKFGYSQLTFTLLSIYLNLILFISFSLSNFLITWSFVVFDNIFKK